MIYVQNNLRYAMVFKAKKDGNDFDTSYTFDCRRVYQDTGNIATTGVTPMDEKEFDWLYASSKPFKDHVDTGALVKTKESGAVTQANKMDSLAKENEILKAKLAEKTKEAATGSSEELDAAKKENESLKAQLEALKKKSKKSEVDEKDSF